MNYFFKKVLSQSVLDTRLISDYPGLAIVSMDMQSRYFYSLSESNQKIILNSYLDIFKYAADKNIPVINVLYARDGNIISPLSSSLNNTLHKTFEKNRENAFRYRSLDAMLKNMSVNTLFMMGLKASICAYKSAVNAKELGYSVHTADDVIADSSDMIMFVPDKSKGLYQKNGIVYHDSYKNFIQLLETKLLLD